jgi:DNA mismatch repair protein MutS2
MQSEQIWSLDLLEYDALKALVGRYVSSPMGRRLVDALAPMSDQAALSDSLASTAEAMAYLTESSRPQPAARGAALRLNFDSLPDPAPHTAKLAIEGVVLEGAEIRQLTELLDRASDARVVLSSTAARFPRLSSLASRIGDFRPLLGDLSGKILPDGTVADHASVALQRIRRDLDRQQKLIHESLERFLRAHRDDGILQEEFVAIRNERFALPIVAGQKRKVAGVIHAASGTGHTLFIEPLETVELNNDLVRLREEEIREVHRILAAMTGRLREVSADILTSMEVLAQLELLFGKARFASDFDAVIPRFVEQRLHLKSARHPLLQDVLQRQRKRVVPLSVTLDHSARTLLISGPNTGGKTVALKTVGLLVLMAQSALPVPCEEMELPLFEQVLADIGDNQSIEQSLSTFSAHVSRIREMLESLGPRSIVLIDELGRATDPDEGGALGVAILDYLRRAGAYTLASTHLMAPKVYGSTTEGVLNASMSFNEQTLEPTYLMRVGSPGASAGLDIARRLGLPEPLIEHARAALGDTQRELVRFLKLLEEKLDAATRIEREVETERARLEAERASLAATWEKRESSKLRELERRAEEFFEQFDARARSTIEKIEEGAEQRKFAAQSQRQAARAKREMREEFAGAILTTREQPQREQPPRLKLTEGSRVRIKDVREPGRVIRILPHGTLEVQAGFMKLKVGEDDIVEVLPETPERARLPRNVEFHKSGAAEPFTQEINLIGKRAEEAREAVDKFLDNAALASVTRVRIVHGHGMGVLKKAIAEMLRGHPHVEKFYEASRDEGGAGATIVELRGE